MAETTAGPADAGLSPGPPQLTVDDSGRATITLNRPQQLNSLHREDLLALQAHILQVAADARVRVLVITGKGRAFCAGFNLNELKQTDAAGQDPQRFERTVDALEALGVPTIARLNGGVYGGATDLALACDFRIGVQGMALRMPAVRLGLHYYPSGLQRFVSRLGLATAKRLFMLGQTQSDADLLRMGYLDALLPPESLDLHINTLVTELQAGAPLAMAGMKLSLNEIAQDRFDPARIRERQARCDASDDLQVGLRAQAARTAPVFTGR